MSGFSIKEAAKRSGLTAHTLRYYDKEGLLPFIGRSSSGNRLFSKQDMTWLKMITCLKNTGMSIGDIRTYSRLCKEGSTKIPDRKAMLAEHRATVEKRIGELVSSLDLIDAKIASYEDSDNDIRLESRHASRLGG